MFPLNNPRFSHRLYTVQIATPLGEMVAVSSEQGVCLLEFVDGKGVERELHAIQQARQANFVSENHPFLVQLADELRDYFVGKLQIFRVPLDPIGTPFQQNVWRILQTIPYGETISYAEQAQKLGNPKAIRAVASANGQNKISIIIPCHRVIGSNGQLTGYAGGLPRKQALLQLEQNHQTSFSLK